MAGELHLTVPSAAAQIGYACAVADRLPRTFPALAAGDAAVADEQLAAAARSKTFGELRSAAHRLVLGGRA